VVFRFVLGTDCVPCQSHRLPRRRPSRPCGRAPRCHRAQSRDSTSCSCRVRWSNINECQSVTARLFRHIVLISVMVMLLQQVEVVSNKHPVTHGACWHHATCVCTDSRIKDSDTGKCHGSGCSRAGLHEVDVQQLPLVELLHQVSVHIVGVLSCGVHELGEWAQPDARLACMHWTSRGRLDVTMVSHAW
jgi:hypothetical protein